MAFFFHALMMAGFAGLLYAPGFVIERVSLRHTGELPSRNLIRICLGTAFWIGTVFFLCAIHRLTMPAVMIPGILSILCVLVFVRPRDIRFPRGIRAVDAVLAAVCLLPLAAVFLSALISCLNPALSWDADVYHLNVPKRYIAHQGFVALPFNVYSNWPLNGEMLFALAMLLKDYLLANSVQCIFGIFTAGAVFAYVREKRSLWYGFLAVALVLVNNTYFWELHTAYVDVIHGFYLLATFILVARAFDNPERRRTYLLLAGISGGIMAGVKVSAAAGLAPVMAYAFLRAAGEKKFRRGLRDLGMFFLPPIILLGLPWVLKAAWYTGNPVYPFLSGIFGAPDWNAGLSRQFAEWQSSIGMGRSFTDYLLLPFRVILSGDSGYDHFAGSISALWIVLLPASIIAAKWNRTVRGCLVVTGIYFIYWAMSSQQIRFLLPVIPVMAIGATLAIAELAGRLPGGKAVATGVFVIGYAVVSLSLNKELSHNSATVDDTIVMYQESSRDEVIMQSVPAAFEAINNLPSDAKLVFINTNFGFHCDREYIADSFFEASQIASWLQPCASPEDIARRLKERGITHILYCARDWNITYPPTLMEFLNDPSRVSMLGSTPDNYYCLLALK